MAVGMRRTIVIGLGGTGIQALINMKREFLEYFKAVPPVVQLRCFDTALPSSDEQGPTGLVGDEFTYIPVQNPISVLEEYDEVRREFPEGQVELKALLDGAGQVRPSGRLALLANAVKVHEIIDDAYALVTSQDTADKVDESEQFDLSIDPKTTVYIVCSLAGGTGGGAFLDNPDPLLTTLATWPYIIVDNR